MAAFSKNMFLSFHLFCWNRFYSTIFFSWLLFTIYYFILIINIILSLHNQRKITGLIGEEERITVSTHDKNPDQVHARNLFPIVDTLTSITAYRRKLRVFTIRVCM